MTTTTATVSSKRGPPPTRWLDAAKAARNTSTLFTPQLIYIHRR